MYQPRVTRLMTTNDDKYENDKQQKNFTYSHLLEELKVITCNDFRASIIAILLKECGEEWKPYTVREILNQMKKGLSYKIIKRELRTLIDEDFVFERNNLEKPYDDTKQYKVNVLRIEAWFDKHGKDFNEAKRILCELNKEKKADNKKVGCSTLPP